MTDDDPLPYPPPEMRALVGPTDEAAFDNPSGDLIFPQLQPQQFEAVFDFGCGCGRLARQLVQQRPPPRRYVGIDLHRGMVRWCQENLAPRAPGFEFLHHDVFELAFNPEATEAWRPFPVDGAAFTLVLAHSVFTHVSQDHAERYLGEVRRVLRDDGLAYTTWFLFDKGDFPMMQDHQNALFINERNFTNAVIFDRQWFVDSVAKSRLSIISAEPPRLKGYQWVVHLAPTERGLPEITLPEDDAPRGVARAPHTPPEPHRVGLDDGAD